LNTDNDPKRILSTEKILLRKKICIRNSLLTTFKFLNWGRQLIMLITLVMNDRILHFYDFLRKTYMDGTKEICTFHHGSNKYTIGKWDDDVDQKITQLSSHGK